jgi:hypothetical protein
MKRALLGLALVAILPLSAQASDDNSNSSHASGVSYNYVEANYASTDWLGANFDGFGVAGSLGFGDNWYGSLTYRQVRNGDADVTLDDSSINLGWHTAMSDKADFLAEVGYARAGADVGGFGSGSSDGYRAAVGIRGMMAPNFEGQVKAEWKKINDTGSSGEFGASVGATYHFGETWGLTASYEHSKLIGENMNTWGLGVRASF